MATDVPLVHLGYEPPGVQHDDDQDVRSRLTRAEFLLQQVVYSADGVATLDLEPIRQFLHDAETP